MAEALVSLAVEKLGSVMVHELEQEVRLVVGVEKEVEKLESNFTAIQAVLADAETKQLKEATIRDWLGKLKDVTYDIEDVLDDWEAAILSSQSKPGDQQDPKKHEEKVCSFLRSSCFCCKQIVLRHDIAKQIKELNERLDRLAQEKDRYQFVRREGNPPIERPMTTSFIDTTIVKGRENDKSDLVNMLLSEPSGGDGSDLRILSVVGMGGIGKTTLAQFALNNDRVKHYFEKKIWVCVSDPFDQTRVAKAILESLLGTTPNVTELQSLLQKIGESVKKIKILLILDDVWEKNSKKWDELKQSLRSASPESKVLVTTRNEKTASVMGCSKNDILKLGKLPDEECWSIVSKIAFSGMSESESKNLEESFAEGMSKKCRGLPLAAKAIGGILRFRTTREGWQNILNSEVSELEEDEDGEKVIAPLLWSYSDLSPALKQCFSYCALFPKDSVIEKSRLIELWIAQGYLKEGCRDDLEVIGEDYFQNLAMRSLFQDFHYDCCRRIQRCKMHDMVHDLAEWVAGDECLRVQVNGRVESIMSSESRKVCRHLSLERTPSSSDGSTSSFMSFEGTKKLRTLLISGSWDNKLQLTTEELSRLFDKSTHVRSLGLRDCDFAEIPSSIRKLVQLRWLDLSSNRKLKQLPEPLCELHSLQTIDISCCGRLTQLPEPLCELHSLQTIDVSCCGRLTQLPEPLCELHSLQTIDVSWCGRLKQLPIGIEKLTNLRHLYNSGCPTRLPKGIGQLIGLRTLKEVDVGCGDDDAFSLGDLKNLNQLRGSLEISGLGAYKRHVGEAREAELKQKERITALSLLFSMEPQTTGNEELLLLEALEPSPNLEILHIHSYRGTTFPGWMISLTSLRFIKLSVCYSCEPLPSLGKLPCLETLKIYAMRGVKKVGKELLGIETQIGESKSEISASSTSSSSSPVVVAFPKLTTLIFEAMDGWEEWEDYYNDNYDGTTKPPPIINIMPSLLSLYIQNCRRLKALPDYILQNTTLRELLICHSDLLKERYNEETGEDWSKISHIPDVKVYGSVVMCFRSDFPC